jgi:hypothetical protein
LSAGWLRVPPTHSHPSTRSGLPPAAPPESAPPLRVIVNANASGVARPIQRDSLLAAVRRAGREVELHSTTTLDELAAL